MNSNEIGLVDSVNGNVVSVRLNKNIKSNLLVIDGVVYRVGQIGSFLKIPLGYANLYGIVTQIGSSAIPQNLLESIQYENINLLNINNQWLTLVLVGEQIGKRFERGISQSPTTGDKVEIVTLSDLEIIYGGFEDFNSIAVGNISASESLNAKLDIDLLVSRHCAIIGSTGSGKSNAVSVILNAIIEKKFKCPRILVIDPHGEYNSVFKNNSKVFKINALKDVGQHELHIPFWALPFNEFINIFPGRLNDQNLEYFRNKIVEYKQVVNEKHQLDIEKEVITADTPIPFSIKHLWFELDDFERQTFEESRKPDTKKDLIKKGDPEKLISNEYPPAAPGGGSPFLNHMAKGILSFLDSVKLRLKDSRYAFLFEPGDYNPDLEGKTKKHLHQLLCEWIGGEKPITILDLSGVPSEIMMSVSGALLNIVYEALFWGQKLSVGGKEQPLLIVLEEAHNYLKQGENTISSKIVQRIAKEGRKYGVGLLLATQRPSELDETVLSQCGTIIALRMNNSKDRGHINAAIQDELQPIMDLLPVLKTGEAIISGESVKIPSRVKFYKISNAPKSEDPKVSLKWNVEKNDILDQYNKLIKNWINQKMEDKL